MNKIIDYFKNLGMLYKAFIIVGLLVLIGYAYESTLDTYEEGMHFGYHIRCENGFIYKCDKYKAIPILNSDGSPLKCGNKPY
jgi:hypothetical protein